MNNNNDDASTAMRVVPDYESSCWLSNKANNLILKKIIDFLASYGVGEERVTPFLDDQKHVHLILRGNYEEEIIFGSNFPQEEPVIIMMSDRVCESNATMWQYNGDIYDSFIRYYDSNCNPFRFVESVCIRIDDINAIKNSSQPVHEGCVETPNMFELHYDPSSATFKSTLNKSVTIQGPASLAETVYVSGPYRNGTMTWMSYCGYKKYNVKFYKGKGVDYQPNRFVVEDIQTDHPKAFYVKADGSKRDLEVEISYEVKVTQMTIHED